MWTPVYYVRLAPLPLSVDGVTLPNNDGSFDIYLNSRHPKQHHDETLTHELNHIQQDHFYNDIKGIRTIEQEADGVSPHRKIPLFPSLEALGRFIQRVTAQQPE